MGQGVLLKAIPAVTGQRQGETLDELPAYSRLRRQTTIQSHIYNLKSHICLTYMFLDPGRTPVPCCPGGLTVFQFALTYLRMFTLSDLQTAQPANANTDKV